jgi:preprotein translocase subunit SecG
MVFIWAFFSDSVAEEKKNYCRATLCLAMLLLILSIILGIVIGGKKINVSKIKDKTSTVTEQLKDDMSDALKDEAGDAVDNYDNLTDDDFTQ